MLAAEYSFLAGEGLAQQLYGFGVLALVRDDQREHVTCGRSGRVVIAEQSAPPVEGLAEQVLRLAVPTLRCDRVCQVVQGVQGGWMVITADSLLDD